MDARNICKKVITAIKGKIVTSEFTDAFCNSFWIRYQGYKQAKMNCSFGSMEPSSKKQEGHFLTCTFKTISLQQIIQNRVECRGSKGKLKTKKD